MAVTWSFRCASWGISSSLVAAVLSSCVLSTETHLAARVLAGAGAILLGISSLIAFRISSLRCSESHTLKTLLLSYKMHEMERLATPFIMARANHMWKHPREAQEDLIRELTRRHTKTEYGRKNRLGEIRSVEDLRRKHPLTTYDHFKGYIQRLADGEEGVFLDEKPKRFAVTSGTTGGGKLIPWSDLWLTGNAQGKQLVRLAIYRGSSIPSPVQKRCLLYTHPRSTVTTTGVLVSLYTFIDFKKESLRLSELSSPPPSLCISDAPTATYIHMLFAIADPNLALLSAMFSPQLYRGLKFLETNWQAMLEDLSTGQINAKLPLDPDVRRSLQGYLRPDQDRVSQLRREFEKGFQGIAKRIWPHLIALQGINFGFWKELQETYGEGVPCVSGVYGGTEGGYLAANMWINEKEPRYVLLPSAAVFEFIPEEHNFEEDPKTLLIDEVEVGGKYELVMTARSGLYRYRNGDVIEVVGFHEKCPVIRMLYRTGEYLSLATEKTNTKVVATALKATAENCWPGLQLVNWTCAESPLYDPDSSALYYVLFVEVDPGEGKLALTAEQKSKFDEFLQEHQYVYKSMRATHTMLPAIVHVVRPGTFIELRDLIVSRSSGSINQYKTPRKMRTEEYLQWLMKKVID